jgi:two-component system CheB/CheR fusion protein
VFQQLRIVERSVRSLDERHYLARIRPYRTTDDKIEGAVLSFVDVTELRRAEQRVVASEERLRLAALTTRDYAIITADEAGSITSWNEGARRLFGYDEGEVLGQPIDLVYTPDDRAAGAPAQEMHTALTDGRAEDERWHQRKNGSVFFCSGVMTPIGEAGISGFVKIARDATDSKQKETAREAMLRREQFDNSQARSAMELKDRFLAVMSHELKHPLNLIQVNAELLMRLPELRELTAVQRVGTSIRARCAARPRSSTTCSTSRASAPASSSSTASAVDLGELVQTAATAAIANVPGKHIALDAQCDAGVICNGDRVRVEQIAWNLLANAAKFTPDGGSIGVRVVAENGFARLTVTDTGCGIAPEFLPHVFGMFNQAQEVASPNGGLGIGLALVHELALAHGGRAEAQSDGIGRGAVFSVWLPQVGTDVPVKAEAAPAAVDLKGWRVLAVDDYAEALEPFAEVLRFEGAIVDTAGSGKEALALLQTQQYDLLVSDLGMPEMDGFQLIGEVRRQEATRELRSIAMSGFGRRTDARRALEAGFDAHLPKPASIEELKTAIARL